jgi:uncharacterized protein (DUF2236 family)
MAGVHEHSDFATAFWPRLQRTAQYVITVAYGTTEQADAAAARVRAVHDRVRGVDPVTGQRYAASDPELLRWVHATEVDSFVEVARRGGVGLDGAQLDTFLAEQVRAAELVGVPDVPSDRATLAEYLRTVRPRLRSSPIARSAALRLAVPPMPLWVQLATPARPLWTVIAGLGFALLPPWARRLYGLPGLSSTDRTATQALRAFRAAALWLPERWRYGPILQDALTRARDAEQPASA